MIIMVIFGLVIFIFLFFPFFGMDIKYQIGAIFSKIINVIGTFSIIIGGLFLIVGVVGLFSRNGRWLRNVIVGVVLLWVGAWCSGETFNILSLLNFEIFE